MEKDLSLRMFSRHPISTQIFYCTNGMGLHVKKYIIYPMKYFYGLGMDYWREQKVALVSFIPQILHLLAECGI